MINARVTAGAVAAAALLTLSACGSSDDSEVTRLTPQQPDVLSSLAGASFESACNGPLNAALQAAIPNTYGDGEGADATVSAINHPDPGIDCMWSGPDGTALYIELEPVNSRIRAAAAKSSPNAALAAVIGAKEAYVLTDDEGVTSGGWISGDKALSISADQTSLTTAQLAAIVAGLKGL